MSPNWDCRIFKVVYQKGAALKLRSDSGVLIFRNVTHVRPYFERNKCQKPTVSMKTADQGLRLERQRRNSKLPARFKDYHM